MNGSLKYIPLPAFTENELLHYLEAETTEFCLAHNFDKIRFSVDGYDSEFDWTFSLIVPTITIAFLDDRREGSPLRIAICFKETNNFALDCKSMVPYQIYEVIMRIGYPGEQETRIGYGEKRDYQEIVSKFICHLATRKHTDLYDRISLKVNECLLKVLPLPAFHTNELLPYLKHETEQFLIINKFENVIVETFDFGFASNPYTPRPSVRITFKDDIHKRKNLTEAQNLNICFLATDNHTVDTENLITYHLHELYSITAGNGKKRDYFNIGDGLVKYLATRKIEYIQEDKKIQVTS